jgi:single-strand DNA-binding protein
MVDPEQPYWTAPGPEDLRMNDNQLIIAGNIASDPVLHVTDKGKSVLSFRLASTARRFDPSAGEWVNGDSLFITVNCWHRLAERVRDGLQIGDPVIVNGRVRQRTYEVKGERRTVFEIEASHVGPDLNRVGVTLARGQRRPRDLVTVSPGDAPVTDPAVSSGPLVPVVSEAAA